MNNLNFVLAEAPQPANNMEFLAKFLRLLNERFPLNRTANFQGNHSIVYDTTGLSVGQPCIVVSIWVFKQLEWRCYPVGLTDEDLARSPEGLVAEIARCLQPELDRLIVPSRSVPQKTQGPAS
jgi:hypothetical protein